MPLALACHVPAPGLTALNCPGAGSRLVASPAQARDCPAPLAMAKDKLREAAMQVRRLAVVAVAAFALTLGLSSVTSPAPAQVAAALTGLVASANEGPMEGVIVSAKKDGSTVTVSVISNAQGRYSFPASRLEPGRYSLQIRAVGYDLEGPKAAEVKAGEPATADLKLRKTRNLSKQLTNAEWMMSVPGSDDQKNYVIRVDAKTGKFTAY